MDKKWFLIRFVRSVAVFATAYLATGFLLLHHPVSWDRVAAALESGVAAAITQRWIIMMNERKQNPSTKRKMLQAWALMTLMMAITLAPIVWRHPDSRTVAFASLILLPLVFATLPLSATWSRGRQQLRLEARARRREAYRASPESHLLHLE